MMMERPNKALERTLRTWAKFVQARYDFCLRSEFVASWSTSVPNLGARNECIVRLQRAERPTYTGLKLYCCSGSSGGHGGDLCNGHGSTASR